MLSRSERTGTNYEFENLGLLKRSLDSTDSSPPRNGTCLESDYISFLVNVLLCLSSSVPAYKLRTSQQEPRSQHSFGSKHARGSTIAFNVFLLCSWGESWASSVV